MTALAPHLSAFLREHLPKERRAKPTHMRSLRTELPAPARLCRRPAQVQSSPKPSSWRGRSCSPKCRDLKGKRASRPTLTEAQAGFLT
jgi:hypothetical protein